MRDRRPDQLFNRWIVGDLAVFDDAAVAVIGVLAQTDVGDHEAVRHFAFDGANGRLDRRLRIVGRRSHIVLVVGQAEQQHALDAVGARRRGFPDGLVDRQVEYPGIEDTSRRTPSPSQTNSGRMNISGDKRVSRTIARSVSLVRSRRSRRVSFNAACVCVGFMTPSRSSCESRPRVRESYSALARPSSECCIR